VVGLSDDVADGSGMLVEDGTVAEGLLLVITLWEGSCLTMLAADTRTADFEEVFATGAGWGGGSFVEDTAIVALGSAAFASAGAFESSGGAPGRTTRGACGGKSSLSSLIVGGTKSDRKIVESLSCLASMPRLLLWCETEVSTVLLASAVMS
jgi:hypothetical protein